MRARKALTVILLVLSLSACGQEELGVIKGARIYEAPDAQAELLEGVALSKTPVCADDFVGVQVYESSDTVYVELDDVVRGQEQLDGLPACTE